jgi:hypothetical protein
MIIKLSYIHNLFLIVAVLKCNEISILSMLLVHLHIMSQYPSQDFPVVWWRWIREGDQPTNRD